MATTLDETTIRDFGGGWNVSDSDKSLGPRYQPISDNVIRGTDGHFRTRYGYKLLGDFRRANAVTVASTSHTVTTVNGSNVVKITKTAHGLTSGQHITFSTFSAAINGIPTTAFVGRTFGIIVNDANNFSFVVRNAATSSSGAARTMAYVTDSYTIGGRTIFGRYYKNYLFVFTDAGEIGTIDVSGNVTRVWSYQIAAALTVSPWSSCDRVSAEIVRGRLIAVNGALNDKPLAIQDTTVNYLVDASTLSNAAIPRAEFVVASSQYILLINTEYGATMVEIGAKNTVMTASREASPSDAVEVDVGMLTQTVESTILGANVIRGKVYLAFADLSMLGTLGIYTDVGGTPIHEPDFTDTIAQFGSFSHSTIISLGNDLYCAGLNGINSLELSRLSSEFVPQTVSDFIHPVLLRHFSRLSENDRRYRTFALFDTTSRQYMLFVPKYSVTTTTMSTDPIYITTTLQPYSLAYINYPNHTLDAGDYIDISGVTDYNPGMTGAMINGRRRIRAVVDKDTIVVEVDAHPPELNVQFGGTVVTVSPVNDETVCYAYEVNQRLKIRRWTRFRNLDFDWGAVSQLGRSFFGKGGKVYQFGDSNNPFSADQLSDYDYYQFANSKAYTVGQRVRDTVTNEVYEVLIAHTSPGAGTFSAARIASPNNWTPYLGEEIAWMLDTAWTDFKHRKFNKQIETVGFDTEGTASFTFSIFTNSILDDFESFLASPVVSTEFVGQDRPGFGGGDQPFGGGRNTLQEWLHSMPAFGKLFRFRFEGSSIHPLKTNAVTLYYHKSEVLT